MKTGWEWAEESMKDMIENYRKYQRWADQSVEAIERVENLLNEYDDEVFRLSNTVKGFRRSINYQKEREAEEKDHPMGGSRLNYVLAAERAHRKTWELLGNDEWSGPGECTTTLATGIDYSRHMPEYDPEYYPDVWVLWFDRDAAEDWSKDPLTALSCWKIAKVTDPTVLTYWRWRVVDRGESSNVFDCYGDKDPCLTKEEAMEYWDWTKEQADRNFKMGMEWCRVAGEYSKKWEYGDKAQLKDLEWRRVVDVMGFDEQPKR